MTGQQPRAWAAIDLLRFACALLVVARHYCVVLPLMPDPSAARMLVNVTLDARWAGWASCGWVGVELFFVISGYVIACSAVGAEPGIFLRRRAQRLLPAAWVCATITVAVLLAMRAAPVSVLGAQWLRSVSFWPLGEAIDPSYWTLGVECAFYLLIAWRLRGGASAERVEQVAWWIGGASIAFWAVQLGLGAINASWMQERLAQLLLLPHGAFFAAGILLQAWHRAGADWRRGGFLVLCLAAGAVEIVAHSVEQARVPGLSASPAMPLLLFALGVALIAGCRRVQPWLGWTCAWSTTLGLMTYPLYLLHQQLGAAIVAELGPGAFPAALALTLILSWAIVRYAEPVLRRWIGSVSARRDPRRDKPLTASP